MQQDGTGVITVFPARWMNKDSQKEGKKDGVMIMGTAKTYN